MNQTTPNFRISVIIPYYNNNKTIGLSFSSLCQQDASIEQVIIVDDASEKPPNHNDLQCGSFDLEILTHSENRGLAATYNTGLARVHGEIVVFMHPDIRIATSLELSKLVQPFLDETVIATTHINSALPEADWHNLTLLEKSVLGSSERSRSHGFNGQFDAVRIAMLKDVGQFDAVHYRTAGEDGDYLIRLMNHGRVVGTDARAHHLHHFGRTNQLKIVLKKTIQYGVAQGVLFRRAKWTIRLKSLPAMYRLLVFFCVLPATWIFLNLWTSILIFALVALPTPLAIYKRDRRALQLVQLVGIQIVRDLCHITGTIIGLVRGRQT